MKLSEMNTVELGKALCTLAAPIGNLASDKKLMDALASVKPAEGQTVGEWISKAVAPLLPVLFGSHMDDVSAIAAALTGKTAEEVKAQNGLVTVRELAGSIDKDFFDFFKPSAGSGRTGSQA